MNKKTLRIAGWALGLSMAVAGIGIAVGTGTKNAAEIKATSGDELSFDADSSLSGDYDSNWAYAFTVGANGNAPAAYADGIRVYNAKGANKYGGHLTLSPKAGNTSAYISSVVITISSTSYNPTIKIKAGNTSVAMSSAEESSLDATDTTYTYSPGNTTTRYIEFTSWNNTSGSYKQWRVSKFVINYSIPKTVSLDLKSGSTSTIMYGETTTLVATPGGGASGTYTWSLETNTPSSGSSDVVTFANADSNEMTFTGHYSGTAVVRVSIDGVHADFTITVNRILDGLVVKTVPSTIVYDEGDDFDDTGLVVTASYLGGASEDIAASSGKLSYSPSTSLSSSTTAITVSYTENGITKSVNQPVTVNAPAYTLDSLTWSASNINAFAGTTLTAETVAAFAVEAVWEEDVANTALSLGTYTLTIGSDEITSGDLPFTWTTSHSGKKLTASYTNNGVTKTASVDVTVVESLNTINKYSTTTGLTQAFDPTTNTSDTTSLTLGDITISVTGGTFGNETDYRVYKNQTMTISSEVATLTKIDFTFDSASYDGGGWSTSYSPNAKSWTSEAANGEQARIKALTVTYSKTTATDIANTNFTVQKAALEYVSSFNETMACSDSGNTENVVSKWSSVASAFSTKRTASGDATNFNNLFKYATAVEGGDSLQDMLARYDYIVAKYDVTDFLNAEGGAGRTAVSKAAYVNFGIEKSGSNDNSLFVIAAIGAASVIASGGFVLVTRKRSKEE